MEAASANIAESIARTWIPVEEAVRSVATMKSQLATILSAQGLDSQSRAVGEVLHKAHSQTEEQLVKVLTSTANALQGVVRELQQYSQERIRTFDEGGTLSPMEAAAATAECKALEEAAAKAHLDAKALVEEARSKQAAALEQERVAFQRTHALHAAEVAFLRRLSEMLGSAKSKITGLITVSSASHQRIEGVIAALEALTAAPATAFRKDIPKVLSLAAVDLESPVTKPLPSAEGTVVGPVDEGTWQTDDALASALLRRARIAEAALLPQSKGAALLTTLDDLRKQLFSRGIVLGCLAFGAEFVLVSPESYFDAKRSNAAAPSASDGDTSKKPSGGAAPPPAAPSKTAGGKPGGAKAAAAAAGGSDAANGQGGAASAAVVAAADDPMRFMKSPRMEAESAKLVAAAKEQLLGVIAQYFKETALLPGAPNPLVVQRAWRTTSRRP
jgi:hypothetical protein